MQKALVTIQDTHAFAEQVLEVAEKFSKKLGAANTTASATVIGLWGNLGAGKTTFTQQLAKILGINEDITSPTFVIEKIYATEHTAFSHLIHIDAYRLDSGKELSALGFDRLLADPKNLIVIEWPERVLDIMPKKFIKISLEIDEELMKKTGEHGRKAFLEEV